MKLLTENTQPCPTEIVWKSEKSKNEFSVKIEKASKVANMLEERDTVLYGVRQAALLSISRNEIEEEIRGLKKNGLKYLIIDEVMINRNGFTHTSTAHTQDKNYEKVYKVVISKSKEITHEINEAYQQFDNIKFGTYMGYPKCCCHFFERVWSAGYVDPLWQQAVNTSGKICDEKFRIKFKKERVYPVINSFLRYVGIRLAFHIPCSLDCEGSNLISHKHIELGESQNLDGIHELEELLNLPVIWSVRKGKAKVETPFFYIITGSVNCEDEFQINME